ncbi:MAG: hypothetical protein Q9190_001630 [Brigantiaea leucoxantha]
MHDPSLGELPSLSTSFPISNIAATEDVPVRLPKATKPHRLSQIDAPTRQRRVAAAQAAKREILANVREDWSWPLPADDSVPRFPRRRASTQWRARESDPSSSPSRSPSPSNADPYRFDSPDCVGEPYEARSGKRRRLAREELEWNKGLRVFMERRDTWTGAETTPKVDFGYEGNDSRNDDSTTCRGTALLMSKSSEPHLQDLSIQDGKAESSESISSEQPVSTTQPSSVHTRDSSLSNSEALDAIPRSPHLPRFSHLHEPDPPNPLIPIGPPLLSPTKHPDLSPITPAVYPAIYSKVVVQGVSPTFPINLKDMLHSLVQGWKDDGEWPPKSEPVQRLAGGHTRSGIKKILRGDGETDGHGVERVARSVGKVKRALGLGDDEGGKV